jgi:hypothetical protein
MILVDSIQAIRRFQRVMLGLGTIGGLGWALLPNPQAPWFGVVSVLSGLLGGLGSLRVESLQAKHAAPRQITALRRQNFLEALGAHPMGSIGIRACASDQEALNLSAQVAQLLRDVGCEVRDALTVGNPTRQGISIGVIGADPPNTERARRLIAAFTAAGFATMPVTTPIGGSPEEAVAVLIGPKPTDHA